MNSPTTLIKRASTIVLLMAGLALAAAGQEATSTTTARAAASEDVKLQPGKTELDAFYALTRLAPREFTAGETAKAAAHAEDLLKQAESMKDDWNYGNAIHAANLVLGRIALAAGDTSAATRRLLAAGRTPGSPQLKTFGPDMVFAKDLLAKGENKAVVEYLDLCAKFWKGEEGKLAEWKAAIAKGDTPDFGPNLRYYF